MIVATYVQDHHANIVVAHSCCQSKYKVVVAVNVWLSRLSSKYVVVVEEINV